MDFDSFKLRELKYRGEGQGRTFATPSGGRFNVRVAAMEGAPHVVRVTIAPLDKRGREGAATIYEDVHFAPEQDLEALVMKTVRMRLAAAPSAAAAQDAAASLIEGWGAKKPEPKAAKQA